jgi:type IV pilus assembly protein PilB
MKGRIAIYELMPITEQLREMILQNAPVSALAAAGRRHGVLSLRQAGLQKALEGITTIAEVLRVTLA